MTITWATPVAFAPVSVAVPVTVILLPGVVEPLSGELIVIVGAVVSCGFCRVTVTVTGCDEFPALSVATALMSLLPIVGSETLAMVQVPA